MTTATTIASDSEYDEEEEKTKEEKNKMEIPFFVFTSPFLLFATWLKLDDCLGGVCCLLSRHRLTDIQQRRTIAAN